MQLALLLIALLAFALAQRCTDGRATGTCKDVSACQGTTKRGLCPGPASYRCCFPAAAPNRPNPPPPPPAGGGGGGGGGGAGWPLHYEAARSCSGRAQVGAVALANVLRRRFRIITSAGIYNCRNAVGGSSLSEHAEGRAIDLMVPRVSADSQRVADFLVANARQLGIQSVIFNRRVWGYGRWMWRAYTGSNPHTDHVHTGMHWQGARGLTEAMAEATFGGASRSGDVASRSGEADLSAIGLPPGPACIDDGSNSGTCLDSGVCREHNGSPREGNCEAGEGAADIQCCIPASAASARAGGSSAVLSDWAIGLIAGIGGTLLIAGIVVAIIVVRGRQTAAEPDAAYTPLLNKHETSPGAVKKASTAINTSTPNMARRNVQANN